MTAGGVAWRGEAAEYVESNLRRGHVTGPYRTLAQDISLSLDHLVGITLRALSPAVNDTFTAMTCTDWIGDGLYRISTTWQPERIRRDESGHIRVIAYQVDFGRLVERAFEKIRQAADGMPAVMIRQLDALTKVMEQTPIGSVSGSCSTRPRQSSAPTCAPPPTSVGPNPVSRRTDRRSRSVGLVSRARQE